MVASMFQVILDTGSIVGILLCIKGDSGPEIIFVIMIKKDRLINLPSILKAFSDDEFKKTLKSETLTH